MSDYVIKIGWKKYLQDFDSKLTVERHYPIHTAAILLKEPGDMSSQFSRCHLLALLDPHCRLFVGSCFSLWPHWTLYRKRGIRRGASSVSTGRIMRLYFLRSSEIQEHTSLDTSESSGSGSNVLAKRSILVLETIRKIGCRNTTVSFDNSSF